MTQGLDGFSRQSPADIGAPSVLEVQRQCCPPAPGGNRGSLGERPSTRARCRWPLATCEGKNSTRSSPRIDGFGRRAGRQWTRIHGLSRARKYHHTTTTTLPPPPLPHHTTPHLVHTYKHKTHIHALTHHKVIQQFVLPDIGITFVLNLCNDVIEHLNT